MIMNLRDLRGALLVLISSLSLGIIHFMLPVTSNAQSPYQWSRPQQIPEYYNLTNAPLMIADNNRTVHAFDLETPQGVQFEILYRRWSLERGWSSPIDIILPVYMGVAPELLDVMLDQTGFFHLIYYGGSQEEGTIYHSKALALNAASADAWSTPIPISMDAGPLAAGQIIQAKDDQLVLVFAGSRFGSGVYETHSSDDGSSWTDLSLVLLSDDIEVNPGEFRLAIDSGGYIHAVWHMDNISGLAEETWYARLDPDLSTWEHLTMLSQKDDEAEFNGHPSIVLDGDELVVFFYDDFPPTRFVRRSSDGGISWTTPVRPFPHQGGYGQVSIAKDSLDRVHIVLGNRLQDPEIHGMWYSRQVGNAWLPLDPITSGPATNSYDPTLPGMVIVQGNLLLAAWSNDVRLEYRSPAWYSYTFLDAPELPIEPLPSAVADTGSEAGTSDSIDPAAADTSEARSPAPTNFNTTPGIRVSDSGNSGLVILLSVAPVVLLVSLLVYFQTRNPK